MKLRWVTVIAVAAVLLLAPLALRVEARGGHGGGGGGHGSGGGVGSRVAPTDPVAAQEAVKKKIDDLLAQGFKALSEGDAAGALDAFSDVVQIKPDSGDAYLGTALAWALKGDFAKMQTALDLAKQYKANPKFLAYNSAVLLAREPKTLDRAANTLENYQSDHPTPLDEILVAAETDFVGRFSDTQRKAASTLVRPLTTRQEAWGKLHADQQRWALAWLAKDQVEALRAAKIPEDYPTELPFLLPDGTVLPSKGFESQANPLTVEASGARAVALLAKRPTQTVAQGGVVSPSAGPPAEKPQPQSVSVLQPAANMGAAASIVAPPVPHAVTHGAAFAIDKNLLVTWDRVVAGAKEITVVATDGQVSKATVVQEDAVAGLALLKVEGDTFEPLALAEVTPKGAITVATFPKASVFQPVLEILRGDLATGTKVTLRMSVHPRDGGAPVLGDQGRVVGLVAAERDDSVDQLPVISAETLGQFCKGKGVTLAQATKDPREAVVEVQVSR